MLKGPILRSRRLAIMKSSMSKLKSQLKLLEGLNQGASSNNQLHSTTVVDDSRFRNQEQGTRDQESSSKKQRTSSSSSSRSLSDHEYYEEEDKIEEELEACWSKLDSDDVVSDTEEKAGGDKSKLCRSLSYEEENDVKKEIEAFWSKLVSDHEDIGGVKERYCNGDHTSNLLSKDTSNEEEEEEEEFHDIEEITSINGEESLLHFEEDDIDMETNFLLESSLFKVLHEETRDAKEGDCSEGYDQKSNKDCNKVVSTSKKVSTPIDNKVKLLEDGIVQGVDRKGIFKKGSNSLACIFILGIIFMIIGHYIFLILQRWLGAVST